MLKEVQLCLHSDDAPRKDYFPQLALKAEGGPLHLTRERERERETAASVPSVCVKVELVSVWWTEVKWQCCWEGQRTCNRECLFGNSR